MLDFSEIKLGKVVIFNSKPCVIIKCDFMRMQQRKPTKKCKMRNLVTGAVVEYTFKSGEEIEEAELKRENATFMYLDKDNLSFMLVDTYETVEVPANILEDKIGYLKTELQVQILYFNEEPISIDLPVKISFKIINTQDVEKGKGNTVSDVMKDAEIESGKIVKVPAFIKVGEKVIINTVEDEYVERDTSK
jgi:elongation factor P